MEKRAEQGVGGTCENNDDKLDKEESKNTGTTAGSTDSAEAPDCKPTAASKPKYYLIASFLLYFVYIYVRIQLWPTIQFFGHISSL